MQKIYTRRGDRGKTGVFGPGRISKSSPLLDAYGTIDELSACIGVALLYVDKDQSDESTYLTRIQETLYTIMGKLAGSPTSVLFLSDAVTDMEHRIDGLTKQLPPLASFILPQGSPTSSYLHLARTICRRAERQVVAYTELEETHMSNDVQLIMQYLNRLSDFLFTLSRFVNKEAERKLSLKKKE